MRLYVQDCNGEMVRPEALGKLAVPILAQKEIGQFDGSFSYPSRHTAELLKVKK